MGQIQTRGYRCSLVLDPSLRADATRTGARDPESERRQPDSLFSPMWASYRLSGEMPPHTQARKMRCQPAKPVVICTHLCFRTSLGLHPLSPQREDTLQEGSSRARWAQGGVGPSRLRRELYSHHHGNRAGKGILRWNTGCVAEPCQSSGGKLGVSSGAG